MRLLIINPNISDSVTALIEAEARATAPADVSLTIGSGELVALLGPSGSGKTTLLRIIAGLESPDEGSILLHGEESTRHSASRRGIGFVFQHYALFRHMTIFENVAFGLCVQSRLLRPSRPNIREPRSMISR